MWRVQTVERVVDGDASLSPVERSGYVQIEMGSTNVRVGSTIFGARDYSK